ncbi:hypothetical protein ASC67_05295 [Methylibium sp. Root1272]|nr:hypothetical protein ASC67_05295 [Methylibium sp. Root1272]
MFVGLLVAGASVFAAASDDEAAKLKTSLTPLGAEKAGNAAGTIPAWTGAPTGSPGALGVRRADPFAGEKPLLSITAQNVGQYVDRLNDGQQAMFKKYPNYRMDVYPTHRTAMAPQWVYDNTFKNATRAKTANNGYAVESAFGGIPFPIPKSGTEVMWNHMLRWQGETMHSLFRTYIVTSDGKRVLASDSEKWEQWPYYYKDGSPEQLRGKGQWAYLRLTTHGPAQKAGEALILVDNLDPTTGRPSWQYLTGQRRVRKLPNATYDTPSFVTSGVSNFDEIFIFSGPMDRYNWKIVGKQEMFIPYNNNRLLLAAKDDQVLSERFVNPDLMRWELHRVWVVEATVADGKRHVMTKRRFYFDEDSWQSMLADGWDAKGQLWRTFWYVNVVAPDLPGVLSGPFGHYNLQTGDWIANDITNEVSHASKFIPRLSDSFFTGDALAGEGVR